jgi:HEAT repeat protein
MVIDALFSHRQIVRWEAAKTLTCLHSETAAPALVTCLEDEDLEVRWLAAEALIGLDTAALVPLLEALTRRAGSVWLCEGAHHVLRDVAHGQAGPIIAPVLEGLEQHERAFTVPVRAQEALNRLRGGSAP